jgi:E3 ubiquitin-protein ligase BRE1
MRDKEAIDNERKNLSRNVEKQGKTLDRFMDTERNLSAQVVSIFLL